ncbi:hypothetical protein [Streptomyces sp. NPDC048106]|uniref:hypothetical protein n=1 Tax=Streptomyces sp. NPDC048106 TaxID=3155750 RepID=UPI0034517933
MAPFTAAASSTMTVRSSSTTMVDRARAYSPLPINTTTSVLIGSWPPAGTSRARQSVSTSAADNA